MMKKLFSIVTLLAAVCSLSSQTMQMNIKVKGDAELKPIGKGVYQILAAEVDNIYFVPEPLPSLLEAVDLGLSVKWANINFLSQNPEDHAKLMQWSSDDVVFSTWGKPYNEKWRMPTREEVQELIDGCKREWGKQGDVEGYWFVNKTNSNKRIFLPITGWKFSSDGEVYNEEQGFYWTHMGKDDSQAYHLLISKGKNPFVKNENTEYFMAIRPVYGDPAFQISMALDDTPSNIGLYSADVAVSVTIDNVELLGEYGVEYRKVNSNDWKKVATTGGIAKMTNLEAGTTYSYRAYAYVGSSIVYQPEKAPFPTFSTSSKELTISNVEVEVTSSNSAKITFTLNGNALDEVTYGVTYALANKWDYFSNRKEVNGTESLKSNTQTIVMDLNDLEAEQPYKFQVHAKCGALSRSAEGNFQTPKSSKFKTPEIVDLGLSVKWSSFNLGAEKEADYGGLFGWGDPEGILIEYTAGHYGGTARDTCIGGDPSYDIVAAQLGGHWRLPTPKEIMELQNCEIKADTKNEVKGWTFTRNGNSIFFPMAGNREGFKSGTDSVENILQRGTYAYVWSDSINASRMGISFLMLPGDRKLTPNPAPKAKGMSVRPVWDDGTSQDPAKDLTREIVEGSEKNDRTGIIPQDGVDMGDGIKWARWNVGAKERNNDSGRFYAWADTIHRERYEESTYLSPWKDKYSSTQFNIDPELDVATRLWRDGWRMPTEDEYNLLRRNCDWTWGTEGEIEGFVGGLEGYIATSKKTKEKLFFPACGYMSDITLVDQGFIGRYWTSSSLIGNPDKQRIQAKIFYLGENESPMLGGIERWFGLPVRAVKTINP